MPCHAVCLESIAISAQGGRRVGFLHDYRHAVMLAWALALSLAGAGCSANANGDPAAAAAPPPPVTVTVDTATEQRIARFIRVSGTLTPEEEADVAAETPGRIVSTPVERGTPRRQRRGARADRVDRSRRAGPGSGGQRRAGRGASRA